MANRRVHAGELVRLLNDIEQPVYVLDSSGKLVFLNRACQELLGAVADSLLGVRCSYCALAGQSPEAAAAAMCPPPSAMAGLQTTGTVAFLTADGTLRRRHATFLPLSNGAEGCSALIVIARSEDLPEDAELPPIAPAPVVEPGSEQLHSLIQEFRRHQAQGHQIDHLIGRSAAARRARRQVELAAGNRCSVLIVGPPGSGRRYTAMAIHYASDAGPVGTLVPLDCAVLPTDLIQSTLKVMAGGGGLAQSGANNTLLLCEVDQLPEAAQAELGDMLAAKPFPARIIATAVEPLMELARRGRFREEFAAALSTLVIELPALTERLEDLPLLAQALLEQLNAKGLKQLGGFTPEALDQLAAHRWPGNLDELARVVEQAYQRAVGPDITVADLPPRIHHAAAILHVRKAEEPIVLDKFLAQVERELIRRATAQAKGNKAKAARLLGMSRPRLYRRMIQLGLIDK
jgi:DNA-binding NtrC family response regulator